MKKKNRLDEQQEQTLLQIEHTSCWLGFWGLLAAITVQAITGFELKQIAGELIVFFLMTAFLLIGCIRNGIWDRYLSLSTKTNVVASLIAAAFIFVFTAITMRLRANLELRSILFAAFVSAAICFVITFLLMTLVSHLVKKRSQALEKEAEED